MTINELIRNVQAGTMTPADAAMLAHPYGIRHFCADTAADAATLAEIRACLTPERPTPARTLEGGLVSDGMRPAYRHIDD